MVEVLINDQPLYLDDNTAFSFSYTIGDILNIAQVQVSYSNAFDFPKNENNTKALNGLGLVGSSSRVPYEQNDVKVKYYGFDIVNSGWINIQETNENNYKAAIREGVLDFWKDIENRMISSLNIDELNHNKDVNNVAESMNGWRPYMYVITDFGGKTQLPLGVVNIDYLAPTVKLSYIWEKIFSELGYTFSGSIFEDDDFTQACITYPVGTGDEILPTYLTEANKGLYTTGSYQFINGRNSFPIAYSWDNSGDHFSSWNFTAPATQVYRFNVEAVGTILYRRNTTTYATGISSYIVQVYKGSDLIGSFNSSHIEDPSYFENTYFDIALSTGQEISFRIVMPNIANAIPITLYMTRLKVEVSTLSLSSLDFVEAFNDFEIKDFVKEVIWRYGLTPIYDANTKNIHFYTVNERINFNNYVDWTDKYVRRVKESYIYKEYAQRNIFAHKYNDEESSHNNGVIEINNQNLNDIKVLAQSKTYAPTNTISTIDINGYQLNTFQFPIWEAEVKEVDGETEIEYKGLNGRFYIFKLKEINQGAFLNSEALPGSNYYVNSFMVPDERNSYFDDLVGKYYNRYENMLNDFKMHEVELALSLSDVVNLDMLKLYYFEQEASFFMLNKLTWRDNRVCKGEFIKINR